MNNKHRATRLLDLQSLLFKFMSIERVIYLPGNNARPRRETDTEHSFGLAMSAWYLSSSFPNLNKGLLIQYALAHDLVEIYAGDVMAIGRTKQQQNQKEIAEAAALERLKSEWPDFEGMTMAIEEYEKQDNKEAIFIKALDKILPVMINIKADGRLWKDLDIKREDVISSKNKTTAKSQEITEIWYILRETLLENDNLFN